MYILAKVVWQFGNRSSLCSPKEGPVFIAALKHGDGPVFIPAGFQRAFIVKCKRADVFS